MTGRLPHLGVSGDKVTDLAGKQFQIEIFRVNYKGTPLTLFVEITPLSCKDTKWGHSRALTVIPRIHHRRLLIVYWRGNRGLFCSKRRMAKMNKKGRREKEKGEGGKERERERREKERKKKGEKKRGSRPSFSLPEQGCIHFSSTLPTHGAKKFPGLACSSSLDRERPASQARRF